MKKIIAASLLGISALALAACSSADAESNGPVTVTVHDEAVRYATACYDDIPSSDGTKLPGTKAFETCVDLLTYGMKDEYRRQGVEIVENGQPVSYTVFAIHVGWDMDKWLTPSWKPEDAA